MLPNEFISSFDKFNQWHLDLKSQLNATAMDNSQMEFNANKHYPELIEHVTALGNICHNFNDIEKEQAKRLVKSSDMYELITDSNWCYQIIKKPYGYAGDFEMMQIMYRDTFEGKTNYGKVFGKMANRVEGSQAVRNRKGLLQNEILKYETGNILSVAAGPAEEIKTVLKSNERPGLKFMALDHDINTIRKSQVSNYKGKLEYALVNVFNIIKGDYRILFPRLSKIDTLNPQSDLKGLNILSALFKYKFDKLNKYKFNLIYTAGLYDYIKTFPDRTKGTHALTLNLFNLLESGGKLIIGNYNPTIPIGTRWFLEYVCDWNLIYRDDNEVYEFSKAINKNEIEEVRIERESTGINSFLYIRKK